VFVSFDPLAAGSRQATLSIADTAVGSPQTVTLTGTASAGTAYYVAPNGSDSNNGTSITTPFLTLAHAEHIAYAAAL
jgi:hypothetical protein